MAILHLHSEDFDLIHRRNIASRGLMTLQLDLVKKVDIFVRHFGLEEFDLADFVSELGEGDIDKFYAYNTAQFGVFVRLMRDSNEYPFVELRYDNYVDDRHFFIRFDSNPDSYPHTTLMANRLGLYAADRGEEEKLKAQLETWIKEMGF